MPYRNGNYSAFYVSEPFSESNLFAYATRDFNSYNLLRAWNKSDDSFPFIDSHNKNYNVRDNSNWELTLKPRLHDRINNSKNVILFLSSVTRNSRALREEIDYAINTKGLPIIVVYPEYSEKNEISSNNIIRQQIKNLWNNLPVFRDNMNKVPTLHIPLKKELIKKALLNPRFMVNSKTNPGSYIY